MWYKCSVNNHLRHHGGPCVTTDTEQTVRSRICLTSRCSPGSTRSRSDGGAILLKAAESTAWSRRGRRTRPGTRSRTWARASIPTAMMAISPRTRSTSCCSTETRFRATSRPRSQRLRALPQADELATRVIEHRGRARCITIDLDPTDDPTHGAHSTRSSTATTNWCYLPLLGFLTFDRESEQSCDGKAVASGGRAVVAVAAAAAPGVSAGAHSRSARRGLAAGLPGGAAAARRSRWRRTRSRRAGHARGRGRGQRTDRARLHRDQRVPGRHVEPRAPRGDQKSIRHRDRETRDNPRFVVTNMRQTPRFLYELLRPRGRREPD